MSTPAVITKMKFTMPGKKDFTKYINYIDREETKAYINAKDFDKYTDYMGNPDKSTGVFTLTKDSVQKEELKEIKQQFLTAQADGSPLWQIVYSFDNEFLKQQNLLSEDGFLNEVKVREAIRKSVAVVQEKEELNDSMVWTGAIHYNTDNIHIHVAMAEQNSSRPWQEFHQKGKINLQRKAKFKQKTLGQSKSVFINSMVDRTQELTHITNLMRGGINEKIRTNRLETNRLIFSQCQELMRRLPEDLRLWRYGNNAMKPFRPAIDAISRQLIDANSPGEFETLVDVLKKESQFREALYGKQVIGKTYADNKLKELYQMVGNSVLTELRELKKEEQSAAFMSEKRRYRQSNEADFEKIGKQLSVVQSLKKAAQKDKQQFLAQRAYERDEYKRAQQKQYEEEQEAIQQQRQQTYGREW